MSEKNTRKNSSSNIIESFDYALRGLVYAIKTERNMRIHMIIAIMVLLASFFLNLSRMEIIAIIFTIALVLITELFNTASERIVNLITEEHHPQAKIIKDMSAGTVFFSSICAAAVGVLIFMKKEVLEVFENSVVIKKISTFPPYLTAVVVFVVIFISLFIKGIHEKQPSLEGGMPSIHTAVAFSLSVMTYLISSSIYVLLISMFLAVMVAHSRLNSRIHNLWEVVAGALLGTLITVFIFQVAV